MPRGRPSKQLSSGTLGGRKLREIREARRTALLELVATLEAELDQTIDPGHINRIETGKIKKPQVGTLEAILEGLHASIRERRDVLEAFGYDVRRQLPTEDEIAEAILLCADELYNVTFPAYLVDDGQRILAWNRYVPRLIGKHPDDPALAQFAGVTTIELAFNPMYGISRLIDNPDEYLPLLIHFVKTGLQSFQEEPWYIELVNRLMQLPQFRETWGKVQGTPEERVGVQRFVPLRIAVPDSLPVQFRLLNSPFTLDPRFQVMHYAPYGGAALRQCAVWAEQEGVP